MCLVKCLFCLLLLLLLLLSSINYLRKSMALVFLSSYCCYWSSRCQLSIFNPPPHNVIIIRICLFTSCYFVPYKAFSVGSNKTVLIFVSIWTHLTLRWIQWLKLVDMHLKLGIVFNYKIMLIVPKCLLKFLLRLGMYLHYFPLTFSTKIFLFIVLRNSFNG